jgi:nucleotide-binding universal stress UspA family protein
MTEESRTDAIVVGVDGSESAARAVRWAASTAAQRNLDVRIVHAFESVGGYYDKDMPPQLLESLRRQAQELLKHSAEVAYVVSAELRVRTEMVTRPPIPLLLDLSKRAGMVVLGSEGRGGFSAMRVGSTVAGVAAHAPCPVTVVRGRERLSGPVVVGVDGSPTSERAIAAAFEEASWRRADLVALHAFSDVDYDSVTSVSRMFLDWTELEGDEQRLLAERLAGWQEKYPDVAVERVVVRDRPRQQLLDWSRRAGLVVTGSRGRGGFAGLVLGSTSQALLQHADCPVLVVHPG